mgnify:CR=1 FL=1|jgi:hypothetical protein
MKIGDLISFKPMSFSDEDWSNPGIVLDQYKSFDSVADDTIWIVWIDGSQYLVNERVDNILVLTGS